eukprot:72888-Alexandrium_andersonii.AAC.1
MRPSAVHRKIAGEASAISNTLLRSSALGAGACWTDSRWIGDAGVGVDVPGSVAQQAAHPGRHCPRAGSPLPTALAREHGRCACGLSAPGGTGKSAKS